MTYVADSEEYVDNRPRHPDGTLVVFCSFCGARDREVRVAQGATAAICENCIEVARQVIEEQK